METTHPEEIWMPDITYIGNRNSHMSLNSLDTQSSLNILKLANRNRLYIEAPLIHHSNRGRPSFLIFAHIFFILKAMAKKEKSIKTLSFPKWRNVCSPYCILFVRTQLPVLRISVLCVSVLPLSRATLWLFACIF